MPALHLALAVTLATFVLAACAPRPVRRPSQRTLTLLLVAQPLSLVAGLVAWPVAGAHAAAIIGMAGVSSMMVAVWLLPREDPWNAPPPRDDGNGEGPPEDDGPPGIDWAQFDRVRERWRRSGVSRHR